MKKLVFDAQKIISGWQKCEVGLETIFSTTKMIVSIAEKIEFGPEKIFSEPRKIESDLEIVFFFS